MGLRELANDAEYVLQCIITGKIDKETYEVQQNLKDELTTMALKNESNDTATNEHV